MPEGDLDRVVHARPDVGPHHDPIDDDFDVVRLV